MAQRRSQAAQASRYQAAADAYAASKTRSAIANANRYSGMARSLGESPTSSSSFLDILRTGSNSKPLPTAPADVPSLPDFIPNGSEDRESTTPSETPQPDPYPTVLPSLSAAQLGALSERRRVADQRLKVAEEESRKRRELLEASANRSRAGAERESKRSMDDFMREVAGRGLARSPMIAGRGVRRAGEDLRLTYGEIDTKLSTEIAALQDLVSQAELARSEEIASISQDEANMRSDLERLLPAANMYG